MNKKYTIVVSDKVTVPVVGHLENESGDPTKFKFTLVCKRISTTEMQKRMNDKDTSLKDLMAEVTTDWSGQRLVMEGDQPAEFCEEALDALLSISGIAVLCFNAYAKESAAKAKN